MPPPPDRQRADLWQCHFCRNGFVSIQLHPACLNCGHQYKGCLYYPLETLGNATRALERRFSKAHSNQGATRPLLQSHTLDSSSPIETDTSSSILPTYPTPPRGPGNTPLPVNELGPTYAYWNCHSCGDGPLLWENHVVCTSCHHRRCGNCSVFYSR